MLSSKNTTSRLVTGARALVTRRAVTSISRKRNGGLRIALPLTSQRGILQSMFYTTERVVEYKSGKTKGNQPATLYRPDRETENCGVGLVASLKSVPSRKVVEQADEMLIRMSHRGGCGCDPASGDGAGTFFFNQVIYLLLFILQYAYLVLYTTYE